MKKDLIYSRRSIFSSEKSPQPQRKIFTLKSTNVIHAPSPESLMRVSNKLLSFSIIKDNFQKPRYISAFLPTNTKLRFDSEKSKGEIKTLDMKDYGLNDMQAEVYSTGLKTLKALEKLNLRGNRLRDVGTKTILESINKDNIQDLDLSNNRIGIQGVNSLKKILQNEYSSLEKLSLENVKITLEALGNLCESLSRNKVLKSLNLSNNKIGQGSGKHFFEMLETNNCLETLDLHWNQIQGPDAILIFQALKDNTCLKTLDLSWNPLGNDKISKSTNAISEFFAENKFISHLDFSNNNFSMKECTILSKGLKENHSIKGLHFQGNYGKVTTLGFIEPSPTLFLLTPIKKISRIISQKHKGIICENCWICEKWTDVLIEWDPMRVVWNRRLKHFALDKLSTQEEPVYVHLEIDGFLPFLLKRNEHNVYFCVRALPQGKNCFFFTYRGVAQISNQYQIEACSSVIEKNVHFYGSFYKKVMAVIVNYLENTSTATSALPRPEMPEYIPPPGDVPEPDFPPWSIENSFFSGFIQDTPELLSKCFETDWNHSKISKFLKSEITRFTCKEILKFEYSKIFYLYKYLTAFTIGTTIFSVSLNTLTDLFQKSGMFDKNFKISDLDLNIKACTQNSVRSHFNSSLSVVRHEFLELFVRIALDKYYRSGLFANEAEALAMFFKKHKFTEVNPCIWRGIRYFNEECDIILTSNKEILVGIYDKYHGVSANYEKKGMTVEDFIGVIQENQMLTDQFSSRYAAICFHFALISRIDEISNLDHMQAGLLEFIEAFARVCDLSDTVDIEKDIFIGYSNEDPPLEKKIEQILSNFSYLKPRKFRRR